MNIAIIGSGVFGISIGIALTHNKDNHITMWSESDESLNKILDSKSSFKPLGGIKIPDTINFTTSYETCLKNADIVFIMVSAKYVNQVSKDIIPYINKNMIFIIGSKGIEQNSSRFIHEVFHDNISTSKFGILSGPSFAIDVSSNEPIGLTYASKNKMTFKSVLNIFTNTNIKVRYTNDYLGVELCGSIKNVIAIASGILEGLGYKESTRSFLITESMHDIKELIYHLGGNKKTILSYAGVGDLILTTTSTKSRNYTYGIMLGRNEDTTSYLENNTVEGYYTIKSIYGLIKKKKINMPLIDLIYKIIMNNEDPNELVNYLIKKK